MATMSTITAGTAADGSIDPGLMSDATLTTGTTVIKTDLFLTTEM